MCRVGNEFIPKIEVRYENLLVEGYGYVGDRALPSLYNVTFNSIEVQFSFIYPSFYILILIFVTDTQENYRTKKGFNVVWSMLPSSTGINWRILLLSKMY